VIDYGRDIRFFSKAQKEAMAVRDRWCACGCGTPARRCDADHRIEWRNYGPSDLRNADPLCRGSHTNKTALNNRANEPPNPTHLSGSPADRRSGH
ncbi:MAG: hypothetical protein ACI8Y4_001913, partial [Candidatus Poriferisodalaceae bacterium]